MRGDDRLREAGLTLLAERIKKAKKKARGARKGDVEAVHDLRVAMRKIRAVLSVLTETCVARGAVKPRERELKALFAALGEARDDDVMLERVGKIAARRQLRASGVDALAKALETDRAKARKRLRALMREQPPKPMLEALGRVAASDRARADERPGGDEVGRSLVRHFAGSVLLARFERVLAYETALPAPIVVMHRLRVAIKKLRYAIDFFGDALGPGQASLDETLKRAQDQLGELHDHHVAVSFVGRFERKHGPEPALQQLREDEDEDAERLLAAFDETWAQITGEAFAATLLEAIVHVSGPRGRTEPRIAVRRARPHA